MTEKLLKITFCPNTATSNTMKILSYDSSKDSNKNVNSYQA